jgi:RimJ/RimL family protein N-acetyltransferase
VAHAFWPLFDLEVRTPTVTLRYPDDELMVELATLVREGVHDPAEMPFSVAWTDTPSPERERNSYRYWWQCRAETTADKFTIELAVIHDGTVVGIQGLSAEQFRQRRTFMTGSWLGRAHQGRGIGTEMRAAVLHLGFAGLGAEVATTGAWGDNARSLAITRRLGYEPNGVDRVLKRDSPADLLRFRMTRDHWETIRRRDIELVGVEPCLPLLGLA